MKGVLLHGGYGTRLRPLTHTGPKQLIPVAGKAMSEYCIEEMREAGIIDIAVILGPVSPEKVREYYGDGSRLGVNLSYIEQNEPRGLAHAIGLAKDFVGKEKFVVCLADNLLKGGITSHAKFFSSLPADALILLAKTSQPEKFGVAKFDVEGKLIGLVEKPSIPPSPYALVGVYFLGGPIFDAISQLKPSARGELEVTEAIQFLIDKEYSVRHRLVEGWWKDTGTPEDILEANRLLLDDRLSGATIQGQVEDDTTIEGRVNIAKGAIVRQGTSVRGPCYVGPSTVIENGAYVGPFTSIGSNCRIAACEIENSIVMDNCQINTKSRIADSLIGPETAILEAAKSLPRAYRFVLGERSKLQL